MIVIVTGVSGAGKTTVGERLARSLGWPFLDADAFHPPANVQKMRAGEPLTDRDRRPWLEAMRRAIETRARVGESVILTCSCLEADHRRRLRAGDVNVRFVYLRVDPATAEKRVAGREDHFFGPGLVASQFAALEEPDSAIVVDADAPVAAIVGEILDRLGFDPDPAEEPHGGRRGGA